MVQASYTLDGGGGTVASTQPSLHHALQPDQLIDATQPKAARSCGGPLPLCWGHSGGGDGRLGFIIRIVDGRASVSCGDEPLQRPLASHTYSMRAVGGG